MENDVNTSKALATLIKHYCDRNTFDKIPPIEKLIPLSIIAWNLSLYPEQKQETINDAILNQIPDNISANVIASFIYIIEQLMADKKRLFPTIKRLINKYEFSPHPKGIKLDVNSIPFETDS